MVCFWSCDSDSHITYKQRRIVGCLTKAEKEGEQCGLFYNVKRVGKCIDRMYLMPAILISDIDTCPNCRIGAIPVFFFIFTVYPNIWLQLFFTIKTGLHISYFFIYVNISLLLDAEIEEYRFCTPKSIHWPLY